MQNSTFHENSFKPDTFQNIDVNIFSEEDNANRTDIAKIGIKDLIDSQDDYHHMEFMKYEMKSWLGSLELK